MQIATHRHAVTDRSHQASRSIMLSLFTTESCSWYADTACLTRMLSLSYRVRENSIFLLMQITHQICQCHVERGPFAGVVLSLYLFAPVMTKQLDAVVRILDGNCYVAKFHHGETSCPAPALAEPCRS